MMRDFSTTSNEDLLQELIWEVKADSISEATFTGSAKDVARAKSIGDALDELQSEILRRMNARKDA
jgi:hypothetical protein